MKRMFLLAAGFAILVAFSKTAAYASPIYSHSGNTDPTSEGWTLFQSGGGMVGTVTNDLGLGIDAWFTDDNSLVNPSFAYYEQLLSPAQQTDADTNGWTLRAALRLVDIPDSTLGVQATYFNGSGQQYSIFFGTAANGDPVVQLFNEAPMTLTGLGSGYHLYEMVYDASTSDAELFVDGTSVFTGYQGISNPGSPSNVWWGAGASFRQGQGNFALLEFESTTPVPEPTSIVLLSIGGIAIVGYGWRRKRQIAA